MPFVNFRDEYPISNRKITDEGYLVARARIAGAGILNYPASVFGDALPDEFQGEKTIAVYLPDEQLGYEVMGRFKDKPITVEHPGDDVTIDSNSELSVGHVTGHQDRVDSFVESDIIITDKRGLEAIESGYDKLSPGYKANVAFTPGVHNGVAYQAIKTDIRPNHIALTRSPRGGGDMKILDSYKGGNVPGVIVKFSDDLSVEIPQEFSGMVQRHLNNADAQIVKLADSKADLEKQVETLKGENKALENKVKDVETKFSDSEIDKLLKSRIEFMNSVKAINPDFDFNGKSVTDVKREIIKQCFADSDLDDKSDEYINGQFSVCVRLKDSADVKMTRLEDSLNKDSAPSDKDGRDEMIAKNKSYFVAGK